MRIVSKQQTERWKSGLSRGARDAERRWAHLGKEAMQFKSSIAERIHDGRVMARRAVKHGYRAGEDFVDDTTHRIRRDPMRALGICFAAGVAAGWLLPHRGRTVRA